MIINKKLQKQIEENNLDFVIKDIESISKELNETNLEFLFNVQQYDFGTKVGKLLVYTIKDRKILADKTYGFISTPVMQLKITLKDDTLK
jgi:hypothetical protein